LGWNKRRTCNAITCFSNLLTTSFVKFRLFVCDWRVSTRHSQKERWALWEISWMSVTNWISLIFSSSDNTEVKVSYLNSSEWHF
jgi:hypothetical protein